MSALEDLKAFKATSLPGQQMTYYRGFVSSRTAAEAEPILAAAWALYATGFFDLAQRRLGRFDYEFIVQRRRKRARLQDEYIAKEGQIIVHTHRIGHIIA